MYGYICTLFTDTEVIAYAVDLLMRRHNLPIDLVAKVFSAPLWSEIDALEDEKLRNPVRAVELAERACELTDYNQPAMLDTLGVAYAAAGRFAEAVEIAEKAKELAVASGRKELVSDIEKHLELYKVNKPYSD